MAKTKYILTTFAIIATLSICGYVNAQTAPATGGSDSSGSVANTQTINIASSPATYTVTTSVTGNGRIDATCNWVACPSQLTFDTVVNFAIIPDSGSKIVSYTLDGVLHDASADAGGCSGNLYQCNVMKAVTANIDMRASFAPIIADVVAPPTTGGIGSNGAVINPAPVPPPTGGAGSNGAVSNPDPIAPATGGTGSNGSVANPNPITLPTGGAGSNGGVTGTQTDNGGGSNGGGSISGGGSYFSGGSSGGSSIMPLFALANTGTSTCPLITTYMKTGANNNAGDVAKLQAFLKNILGIDLIVNGQFDQATENAVRAFQSKYMTDVMGPWGATQSSGFVYITTLKQINKLACNSPFALSAADMSIINAYKARVNDDGSLSSTSTTGPVLETGSSTTSSSTDIGLNDDGSQTASVGNASILSRFWNFILSLFR